jgi:hypothetical protein
MLPKEKKMRKEEQKEEIRLSERTRAQKLPNTF